MRAVTRAGALPAALLLAALASPTAQAQDRGNPGWYVRVAPYLWASNIDGAVSLGLPADPQQVGQYLVAIEDTLLEPAWAVRAEVGKGRVRAWFNISQAGLGPKPTEIEPIDSPADTLEGTFDFTWFTGEAFAAIQVGPFATTHAFELYAGSVYISGQELAEQIRMAMVVSNRADGLSEPLCLAVLSACDSGAACQGGSDFNGVAQSLIHARIPAVIAMQFGVTEMDALEFVNTVI